MDLFTFFFCFFSFQVPVWATTFAAYSVNNTKTILIIPMASWYLSSFFSMVRGYAPKCQGVKTTNIFFFSFYNFFFRIYPHGYLLKTFFFLHFHRYFLFFGVHLLSTDAIMLLYHILWFFMSTVGISYDYLASLPQGCTVPQKMCNIENCFNIYVIVRMTYF